MEQWEGRSVYIFQLFAMFEALVSVVHFIVSTPAAISCVGGGGHRTSSSSNCSTRADVGVHRTSSCSDRSTFAGGEVHPASDYRVCGASTRRVRSTSPQWRSSLHSVCRVCDGGTRRVRSASDWLRRSFRDECRSRGASTRSMRSASGQSTVESQRRLRRPTYQLLLRAAETLRRRLLC